MSFEVHDLSVDCGGFPFCWVFWLFFWCCWGVFLVVNTPVTCSAERRWSKFCHFLVEQRTEPVLTHPAMRAIHTSTLIKLVQDKHNLPLKSHGASMCQNQPLTCSENVTLSEQLAKAATFKCMVILWYRFSISLLNIVSLCYFCLSSKEAALP